MLDWWKQLQPTLADAFAWGAGITAGYLVERALLRPRLDISQASPQLGELEGDTSVIHGPDGVRLFVEEYGPFRGASRDAPGDAPGNAPEDAPGDAGGAAQPDVTDEIVFVHGFAMSGRCWHEQVEALRSRARLVTYDQPGHARSSPPRSGAYSVDLLADALAAVIDKVTGSSSPVGTRHAADAASPRLLLVGHSMGGMTILALARRHPQLFAERVRGVLLLSTTAHSGAEDLALGIGIQALVRVQRAVESAAGLLGERARHLARVYRASSDLSHLLTKYFGLVGSADPRYVDLTEQLVLDTDPRTVMQIMPALLAMDEDEALTCLDVPTIILVGSHDRLTPPGHALRMGRVNPDVDVVELPGIGHMTPMESHESVTALIVHLLDRTRARGSRPAGGRPAAGTPARRG